MLRSRTKAVVLLGMMVGLLPHAPAWNEVGLRWELPPKKLSEVKIGQIIGYNLDEPGQPIHAGIYAGLGTPELRTTIFTMCGIVLVLDPNKHYIIEYSGPMNNVSSPQKAGRGGQKIWISEMNFSQDWYEFVPVIFHNGEPSEGCSGEGTLERALSQLGSEFGGYDVVHNNCQHFSMWAKHWRKHMLLRDEGMVTFHIQWGGFVAVASLKALLDEFHIHEVSAEFIDPSQFLPTFCLQWDSPLLLQPGSSPQD